MGILDDIARHLNGRYVGYDIVGPAAFGTGTDRANINATYQVPSAARELIGIIPSLAMEAPSAADSLIGVFDIIGTDFNFQPCEVLGPVASGKLGAIDEVAPTPMEFWPVHAPLKGSEKLNVGVEPLSAIATDNAEASVTMVFASAPTGFKPIYGISTREVAGPTTAATTTSMTDLTVSKALQMVEVWGVAVSGTGTVVADEEMMGYFTFRCTQWDPWQELKFFHEPIHPIEATTGPQKIAQIMRLPFNARFKATQATVKAQHYNYDAFSNAGVLASGFRYVGTQ